ncbi:DUF3841 domain-containing protein [Gottfriedia acidiceleris]|uniref:DUF3841 domain-containing protein n=1 Tax=Gottfriedia acidiceleris TaxID=371036 RepID=UPI0033915F07
MKIYTVQPLHVYKQMRKDGFYHGHEKYVWPEFKSPYSWMMEQMKERLPNYDGSNYPVWVWNKKPNRNRRGLLPPGTKGVILTLVIPDKNILWSCFNSWHSVLSNCPITRTEEEWEQLESEGFPEEKIISTWTKIFDFDWLKSIDKDWMEFDPDWIQGVTPRIEMRNVVKVNRFIAK